MHQRGQGGPKDVAAARTGFERALELGYRWGHRRLATLAIDERDGTSDLERALDRNGLLRKAKKIEEEEPRLKALSKIYYLAGMQQVALGKPKIAAKYFKLAQEKGEKGSSIYYSAARELERMEGPS